MFSPVNTDFKKGVSFMNENGEMLSEEVLYFVPPVCFFQWGCVVTIPVAVSSRVWIDSGPLSIVHSWIRHIR